MGSDCGWDREGDEKGSCGTRNSLNLSKLERRQSQLLFFPENPETQVMKFFRKQVVAATNSSFNPIDLVD